MVDYRGDNLFESDEKLVLWMLCYGRIHLGEGIDLTKS